MDIKLIGIWNDSASDRYPLFDGLPVIGEIYEGHLDPDTQNSWLVLHRLANHTNAHPNKLYKRFPNEFFMPLAEWRDKQIDSILEDA
jgi:hypothetical protein